MLSVMTDHWLRTITAMIQRILMNGGQNHKVFFNKLKHGSEA